MDILNLLPGGSSYLDRNGTSNSNINSNSNSNSNSNDNSQEEKLYEGGFNINYNIESKFSSCDLDFLDIKLFSGRANTRFAENVADKLKIK